MFGEYIKRKRLAAGYNLKAFCELINEDPSNWSKVERKLAKPPQKYEKLKLIADVLEIRENSEEWKKLTEMAKVHSGYIPEDMTSNEIIMNFLPAFFRTVRSEKPKKEDLDKFLNQLKGVQ